MSAILVTLASHYVRGPDDGVYAVARVIDYRFWSRYLAVFNRVGVAARVARTGDVPEDLPRADGPGVEFRDLPDYVGPWQYLRQRRALIHRLRAAIRDYDAFCLRVACPIGTLAWRRLRRLGRPFGVEVVADPWDALGPGSVKSIIRPVARWLADAELRAQCRTAIATAYVTRAALQRRYPPAPGAFTTHYSSIELPAKAIAGQPRTEFGSARRLIYVGTLAVLYKAPDVLIRALAKTGRKDLHLTVIGDGRERPQLEVLAGACGAAGQVTFTGQLPAGQAARQALDQADLYVVPSRQEGLPRAMIEAMARGLPCIGSTAGGIPELLEPEDLVPPGDAGALARKIVELIDDPERLRRASARNLERAGEFLAETLTARRREFYETLKRVSCPGR